MLYRELTPEEIDRIVCPLPGDFAACLLTGGKLKGLSFSESFPASCGVSAGELRSAENLLDAVVPGDRARVLAAFAGREAGPEEIDCAFRLLHRTGAFTWVHVRARLIGTMGEGAVVLACCLNLSDEAGNCGGLMDDSSTGVCVTDLATHEILYANPAARTRAHAAVGESLCYRFLFGRDEICGDCPASEMEPGELRREEIRLPGGQWLAAARRRTKWCGRECLISFLDDITAEKEGQREERANKNRYELAVRGARLAVWEYDIKTKRMVLPDTEEGRFAAERYHLKSRVLENVPDSMLSLGVSDADRERFLRLYEKVRAGEEYVTGEFWFRMKPGEESRCERITYYVSRDEQGQPAVAYGTGQDITLQKQQEQRFDQMLESLSANMNTLFTVRANLTRNRVAGMTVSAPGIRACPAGTAADDLLESGFGLPAPAGGPCPRRLGRGELLERYQSGESFYTVDCAAGLPCGERIVTVYLNLVQNPYTGDVELLAHAVDTTENRIEQAVTGQICRREFDYIALIDLRDGTLGIRRVNDAATVPIPADGQDYARAVAEIIGSYAVEGERESAREKFALSTVLEALNTADAYSWTISMTEGGEKQYRKLFRYSYLDASKKYVLLTRSDITEAFFREREDAERLRVALIAAKQASSAKSNFLSRMSHEIRTPMNAIIGMGTLAAQSIGDDEKVADYIGKIGISARYLLSLINDILDMSRIESGKMLLKNEKFLFRDFISGLNTIIYNQAASRGLDYECVVSSEVDEAYIGDAMKLQQILVNVLGNAVKFTKKGKVSLEVRQISRTGGLSRLRFIVNDTGCGISEENLSRIFEPFEQADTSTTTAFGGTGLGLAITKNLVDLMGGIIRVRSIVDVGSEFTIDIPLSVDESVVVQPRLDCHFEKLHTLVVDDDAIICEQTSSILKEIGMIGEWVTSGREAVERVRQSCERDRFYDFILIDWKMPDMDGIETTRRIRKIVGPEVTIIIISAYDWEMIEADAKAAGANLLISKPLFRSTLVSAFQRARGKSEGAQPAAEELDFTGRRILLAEDNQINAEIARCLLENRHFSVELAPNGLRALEMFAQNPVHYYDAILMDVRMPMMDGLQATANIRHWNKADARTIPIIAMTANAFDEDVEKSRAAGMNAHLSKPIEPELLYRTLYRIICEKETL